jgi:hypothetical protein
MTWHKRGLIWGPDGSQSWAVHSALQPTPLLLDDRIRVFVGVRDADGRSSVAYVDLARDNPSDVIAVSQAPVLRPGAAACFDEFGVVPSAVSPDGARIRLYYAGYQRPADVRFRVFGGLAWSDDFGRSFVRHSAVPVLGPSSEASDFRVPHSVIFEEGLWKVWYGAGSAWRDGQVKTLPVYDIRYLESVDGVEFAAAGDVLIAPRGEEHRLGRPSVTRFGGARVMAYGVGTEQVPYRIVSAVETHEGWVSRGQALNFGAGWDSRMIAYPALLDIDGRLVMFYNGNDYGRQGFGWAELDRPARFTS